MTTVSFFSFLIAPQQEMNEEKVPTLDRSQKTMKFGDLFAQWTLIETDTFQVRANVFCVIANSCANRSTTGG